METAVFAFLAGLGMGLIGGSLLVADASVKSMKKRIQSGYMEENGVVYRVTRLDREMEHQA